MRNLLIAIAVLVLVIEFWPLSLWALAGAACVKFVQVFGETRHGR